MAIHCMLLTGDNIRIVQNFLSEFKDKYDCMQTFDMVRSMISAWQSANFKDGEEPTMPTKDEIEKFIQSQLSKDKQSSVAPVRGTYEVSTAGDKRFSALNATFAEGTIIDGVDVSGKTIEYVYQNVIKKSGKGKAPSQKSRLNLNPTNVSEIKRETFKQEVINKYGKPLNYSVEEGIITLNLEKGTLELIPFAGSVKDDKGASMGNKDINYFVGGLK